MLEGWLFSVFLHSHPVVMVIRDRSPTPALQLPLFFPCITGPCLFGISIKCHYVVLSVQGYLSHFLRMDTVVRAFILCSEQEAQTRAPDESPGLCCSRPSTLLRKRHLSQFQRNRSHCTFLKTHLSLLPCRGAERKADYLCLTSIISSDSVDRRFQVRGLDCFAYHGISAAWHSAWNLAGDQ